MHHTQKILLASLLLFPLSALSQTEVPNAFSDGTPALAAEVNENFTAVADGVNAQDVRIQSVENAIAGPAEMVFLGYAEGTSVITADFYGLNQVCKDAYSNPAARVVTTTAWATLVSEGQLPLPSASAEIYPNDTAWAQSGGSVYSPTVRRSFLAYAGCYIRSDGRLGCDYPSPATLTACMAPAG